jgi:hypothetical protein
MQLSVKRHVSTQLTSALHYATTELLGEVFTVKSMARVYNGDQLPLWKNHMWRRVRILPP